MRLTMGLVFARAVFCCAPLCAAASSIPGSAVLRVCADPNNLPFSNRQMQGFENKIAALLSDSLGAQLSYTWWAEREHLVRNTLDADRCDVLLGVPAGIEDALETHAYYTSSYVFVYRKDSGFTVTSLNDSVLEKLRIGVHILGDSYAPPAAALARRGVLANVRGFSMFGAPGEMNPPAKLIQAVEDKSVDLAIVWGPLGGYFAQHQEFPLTVIPVSPDHDGPIPFFYSMALAVRKGNVALRDRLNKALEEQAGQIQRVLAEFGVPQRMGH